MKKKEKIFLKQEKRLIRAAYRAGLLVGEFAPDTLSWEVYYSKFPSVHYWYRCSYEYDEWDSNPVANDIQGNAWFADMYEERTGGSLYPEFKSTYKWMDRPHLIKHLESLPRKVNDSKINKILKITWREL